MHTGFAINKRESRNSASIDRNEADLSASRLCVVMLSHRRVFRGYFDKHFSRYDDRLAIGHDNWPNDKCVGLDRIFLQITYTYFLYAFYNVAFSSHVSWDVVFHLKYYTFD